MVSDHSDKQGGGSTGRAFTTVAGGMGGRGCPTHIFPNGKNKEINKKLDTQSTNRIN